VGECQSGKHEDDPKPGEEIMRSAKTLMNPYQNLHLQGFSRVLFAAAAGNGYTSAQHGRRP
jgi:hypothetical protein